MTDELIEKIALSNGFKLKEQPDGSMALNPYVFAFARALLAASQDKSNHVAATHGAYTSRFITKHD